MGSTLQITCCSTTEEIQPEPENKPTTPEVAAPIVYTYKAMAPKYSLPNLPRSLSNSTIRQVVAN